MPVSVWMDNTFVGFWVVLNADRCLTVSHQIVIKFKSSWLFVSDNDISDFQEELRYFRILIVEFFSSFDATRRFVGLEDE